MAKTSRRGEMRTLTAALLVLAGVLQGCALIARQGSIIYMAVTTGSKDIEIQLNTSFVERYKNRVTISATFTVDQVMPQPVPASLDGDLHFAGRSPQIALPVVGEIANAALHKDAMEIVHRAGGSGTAVNVTGVWRIWPEHSGGTPEVQGNALPTYTMSNPKHIFEIHPVTSIEGFGLLDSFVPVEGFKPGDAQRTFAIYEKATCTVKVQRETISISTQQGLYNDVGFTMQLADDPQQIVDDGRFVIASAMNSKGDTVLVKRLRMVFAKGAPPEIAVRTRKAGDKLHVYGIPRVDIAEISRRVRGSDRDASLLAGTLPYEIIILGVYDK